MRIKDLCEESHNQAILSGWWDTERTFPEAIMMVITELSESVQKDRSGDIDGCDEELADTFIRLADICQHYEIDIELEIKKKMEINKKRIYKHGKKY